MAAIKNITQSFPLHAWIGTLFLVGAFLYVCWWIIALFKEGSGKQKGGRK